MHAYEMEKGGPREARRKEVEDVRQQEVHVAYSRNARQI